MGEVLRASEKPNECTTLLRDWIPNRPAQSGVGRFQSIEHGALGHGIFNLKLHLVVDPRQRTRIGLEARRESYQRLGFDREDSRQVPDDGIPSASAEA